MDTGVNRSGRDPRAASGAHTVRRPQQRPKAVRSPPEFSPAASEEEQLRQMDRESAQTQSRPKSYVGELQALAFTDETPVGAARPKKNAGPKPEKKRQVARAAASPPKPKKTRGTLAEARSRGSARTGAQAKSVSGDAARASVRAGGAEPRRRKMIVPRRMSMLRRFLFAGALILALLLAVTAGIYGLFFKVTEIEAVGLTRYAEEDILAASGVEMGDRLFSFRSKAVKERIVGRYPFIRSVEVTRVLPNRVELTVTEDGAVFYANVFGEYYLLSGDLRVLGKTGEAPLELVQLKLPLIHQAVAGAPLKFMTEKNERYVREAISDMLASPMAERIDSIDLRDKYNLTMVADGRYKLVIGAVNEVRLRLRLAEKVLEDTMFQTGNKAVVDLSRLEETSVIIDNQLVLD